MEGKGTDIFITSLTASGAAQWLRSYGGSGEDYAFDVVVVPDGDALVVGQVSGSFSFGGVAIDTANASSDAFIARLDNTGAVRWVTTGSGAGRAYGNEVALDSAGNVLATGVFRSQISFGSRTLTAPTGLGNDQVFVAKLDGRGVPLWARAITGPGVLAGRGIGRDGGSRVLVAGEFSGDIAVDDGAGGQVSLTSAGGTDCFVAAYDAEGALQWARAFGGSGDDKCRGVGGDAGGNVGIAGTFSGSVVFGTQVLRSVGASNLFLTRLDAAGRPLWARALGSTGTDEGSEIEVAEDGTVVMAGEFGGTATLPWGQQVVATAGAREMFATRVSATGAIEWFSTSPGSADDVNYALSVGLDGGVTLVGAYGGTLQFGATTLNTSGGPSSFVARLGSGSVTTPTPPPPSSTLNFSAAADFLKSIGSSGTVVMQDGRLVFEAYMNGYDGQSPKAIASGTKSFSCALSAAAEADGLMTPSLLASTVMPAWAAGGSAPQPASKSKIRLQDLLSLSAGLRASGVSGSALNNVDSYAQAVASPSAFDPGVAAIYTPNNFQAVAALFELSTGGRYNAQGVIAGGRDPLEYLKSRVLDRIGLVLGEWQRDLNGKPNFGGGASLTARDWAKFGQLMLNDGAWSGVQVLPPRLLSRCASYRTDAFWGYGMAWWLNREVGATYQPRQDSVDVTKSLGWATGGRLAPSVPADMYMAAGFGGYRLYVIPSLRLVAVRMGGRDPSDATVSADDRFLGLLIGSQR
ncbi:MAG: serine hydrolase domain-containing protein [Burkholderiales bacterium]|jgi:CubicO group peptidase (beta-lactamase class C family)